MNVNGLRVQGNGLTAQQPVASGRKADGAAFAEVLRTKMDGLRFSAHAETRLKSRNISMSSDDLDKLGRAVQGAERKGGREALILFPDKAFIVNIPNKTVVTAMDGKSVRDNVFTNIDSTVIAG